MRAVISVAALGLTLAGCGGAGGGSAAADPAKAKALLAALPVAYRAADLGNGRQTFALCRSCHTLAPDGADMTGPALYGVFGRRAGTRPGFAYSDAVRTAGFDWDADHLDKWLAKPRDYLPGTKMTFTGLSDPKDRRDVIAYLAVASGGGPR